MSKHILGPYWAVMHRRPADYDFFRALKPPVVKIMDGGSVDHLWVYQNLPEAQTVMRIWELDDNHGRVWANCLADPVGTGERVARQMVAKAREWNLDPKRTLLMGPTNEPNVWVTGGIEAAVKSTVAFADELHALGWPGLLMNLPVGWPANSDTATVKDTPPDWSAYAPILPALRRGDHVLGLHEYWKSSGVADGWGWYGGRALKCPWDVPIIIGECGFSYAVGRSGIPTPEQGWRLHITDEQYAAQIVDYHNRMAADHRIKGLCLYLCDYANREWESKDVEPAYDNILARKAQLRVPAAPTPKPEPDPTPVGAVTNVRVNIRTGASTAYPIVRTVDKGTAVQPTHTNAARDWLRLVDGNWIAAWLVDGEPANLPVYVGKEERLHPPLLGGLTITQIYGVNAENYRRYNLDGHNGTDFRAASGSNVYAVADGVATVVGDDPTGYGLYVMLWHPTLRAYTLSAHFSRHVLKVGETVKRGQVIGKSGNTGNSTGAHLHFEVRLANAAGAYEGGNPGMGKSTVDPVGWMAGIERG